jgi:hypothetical protein
MLPLTIRVTSGNLLVKYENMILAAERHLAADGEEQPVRVAPLPADQWDDAVLGALRLMPEERRNPVDAGNAVATFVLPADALDASGAVARTGRPADRAPHPVRLRVG